MFVCIESASEGREGPGNETQLKIKLKYAMDEIITFIMCMTNLREMGRHGDFSNLRSGKKPVFPKSWVPTPMKRLLFKG